MRPLSAPTPRRSLRIPGALLAGLLLCLSPMVAIAQEEAAETPPPLRVEKVVVEPGSPAVDTLCKLRVAVSNQGAEIASQLDFKVRINDQELPVYRNQLFMYPLPPGETTEVKLYNFWSTETSRPAPADGKLRVEVSLVEAQWMKIADEEGVEVWTPLGAVEGLPTSAATTLTIKSGD